MGQIPNNSCSATGFTATDSLGNTYTRKQFVAVGSGGGTQACIYALAASSSGQGSTETVTVNCADTGTGPCAFDVLVYVGFVGFGQSSTFTSGSASGSDTRSITVGSGSLVVGVSVVAVSGVTCGSVSPASSQTILQTFPCQTVSLNGSVNGDSLSSTLTVAGTYTDTVTWTGGGGFGRFIMELASGNTGSVVTVTQCFGNCGSPAVTLANTNSTHLINFNQSITIFYIFQSSLNGFFVNASTNLAKSYSNGQTVYLGLYIAASCPLGSSPFSANCPGSLITSNSYTNPSKGKITLAVNNGVALTNGEYAAVAVSCLFSPCDLNDTNTAVGIQQTNGVLPTVIAQSAPLSSCSCKLGLWSYIMGNIVTGVPTPTTTSGICGPGLDSILGCAVNSLCTVVTSQCQTGSSIFLIVVLTIFSIAVLLGIFSYWLPGMNISTKGMGEFAILTFIGWFVAFASFGLLLPYLTILMFFVIAWLFFGRLKGSGPV